MELAIIRDRPPQQIRRVTRQPRLVTAVNKAGPATLTRRVSHGVQLPAMHVSALCLVVVSGCARILRSRPQAAEGCSSRQIGSTQPGSAIDEYRGPARVSDV